MKEEQKNRVHQTILVGGIIIGSSVGTVILTKFTALSALLPTLLFGLGMCVAAGYIYKGVPAQLIAKLRRK